MKLKFHWHMFRVTWKSNHMWKNSGFEVFRLKEFIEVKFEV